MSYQRLIGIVLMLTYLLIIVGGATRVFDAGVSCPDWPHCYGHLVPFPESAIPGGYVVSGQHFEWWQVALEWSHRTIASIVSVGMLAILVIAVRKRRAMPLEKAPLIAAIFFLLVQIGLGGLTVLKANIDWSVVLHLGTAMLFFASLTWLRRAVASGGQQEPVAAPLITRLVVYAFAFVVWSTMLVGAFVSSSHSGGVCGGLFSCAGQWAPVDLQQHMHMQHRFMALTTAVLSIILLILAKRTAPRLRASALHGHAMVWGQVILGVATLYSFADYPDYYPILSIAHLAWGTLVWLAAVGIILNLHYGQHGRFHDRQH